MRRMADQRPRRRSRWHDEVGARRVRRRRAPPHEFTVSAPTIVLAAAAARTKRIRLTSAVSVISSDDPVRVVQASRRSTWSPAGAPSSWPAAARSSSRSRCSATAAATTASWSPRARPAAGAARGGERRPGRAAPSSNRRARRLPAPGRRIRAGVDRGRRHIAVARPPGSSRPGEGARDHRRSPRSRGCSSTSRPSVTSHQVANVIHEAAFRRLFDEPATRAAMVAGRRTPRRPRARARAQRRGQRGDEERRGGSDVW